MPDLQAAFENLVEEGRIDDVELAQEADYDVTMEELLDQAIVTAEACAEELDALSDDLATLEEMDEEETVALESLSETTQQLFHRSMEGRDSGKEDPFAAIIDVYFAGVIEKYSAEGFDSCLGMEEKVGGVSNGLRRLWQTIFIEQLKRYDFITDLVKSASKKADKYRDRSQKVRKKLRDMERDLTTDTHRASLDNLHNYFFSDSGFPKTILGTLRDEIKLSQYVMFDYPDAVEKEIGKFANIVKQVDLTDPGTYEETVEKPMSKELTHPALLFDRKYIGGRPFMMNTGFKMAKSFKRKQKSDLDILTMHNYIKTSKWMTDFKFAYDIIPDVEMKTKEVYDLLDYADELLEMVVKKLDSVRQMERTIGFLRDSLEKMVSDSGAEDDKVAKKYLKPLSRYTKNLVDCYWSPGLKFAKRDIDLSKGCTYLAGRLIAGSE